MKRYLMGMIFAGIFLCSSPAFAKEAAKAPEKAIQPAPLAAPNQPAGQAAAQEKEALVTNINNLRNADLRAMVLQQLLSEEMARRQNLEAVFCDRYKLDINKFRKGLYSYDEKEGKFTEQAIPIQEKK